MRLDSKDLTKIINDQELAHGHDHSNDSITSIICINMTEHKYYIFSQSGILINRVNFF